MAMTSKRQQQITSKQMSSDGSGATRRTILKAGALATGALAMPESLAARSAIAQPGGNTKVTVVLFQHGGADHLNLYAPTGDANYASLRPTIGVGTPGSGAAVEGLHMDAMFSMHPAMLGTNHAFRAQNSSCAVVHACGYSPFSRSHFESMDLYETALAGLTKGGWINRHLQVTATPQDVPVRALALTSSVPMSMKGLYPCYSVAGTEELAYSGASDTKWFLDKLAHGTSLERMLPEQQIAYQAQRDSFALLDRFLVLDPANYAPANGAVYPTSHVGKHLRQIAEVIKADLGVEFFALEQHGWDHHSNLVAKLGVNVEDLDQAVTAFFDDLGAAANNVVLVTMSEFGRTAAENGSGGTDHGVGGAMLLRGGHVRGGQVYGTWPGLAPAALVGGHSLAATSDFRDVLREVLEVHMGGTDAQEVFPGRIYQPIGVL
jgi:uncharacterized protein (DUF1501 family)